MDTETLTGRELDVAVAEAMGWIKRPADPWPPPEDKPREVTRWETPDGRVYLADEGRDESGCRYPPLPAYSAADCSGLAPVLAWLEANRPTKAQAGEAAGLRNNVWGVSLSFDWDEADRVWQASYSISGEWAVLGKAPTLPAAACRLLVAWAAKREGRES